MYFYKNKSPEIDDIVMCNINKISTIGIEVSLLEYNNKKAFLNFRDVTNKKKMYHIKQIIKINKIYPLKVINIDKQNKNIDVSKKYQLKEEEEEFKDFYNKYKKCILIMNNLVRKLSIQDEQDKIDSLYKNILWKYNKYKIYDIFNSLKNDKTKIKDYFDINDNISNLLFKIIKNKLPVKKYTVKFNIKINSLHIEAQEKIINYLKLIKNSENVNPYIKNIPIYTVEYKNILETNLDSFIENTQKKLKLIPNKYILLSFENIEKY